MNYKVDVRWYKPVFNQRTSNEEIKQKWRKN